MPDIPDLPRLGLYEEKDIAEMAFEVDGLRRYSAKLEKYIQTLLGIMQQAGIQFPEGGNNATQEGQQPQNNLQQHQGGDQGGQTAETGRRNRLEQGGKE